MGRLDGRVAIVTGAGRGLGRAHAHLLAALGARVVVNDLGGSVAGEGRDSAPATQVVEEIRAGTGTAIASTHDISDWAQAAELIRQAREQFGRLDIVVNNAGILRDRTLANMSEQEWDAVIRVHLKGHAAMTCHAMAYWRDESKAGRQPRASLVHTSSASGLGANFGQGNYAAAKLGIVALSATAALEGEKYGVRSNVVSPSAMLTRLAGGIADNAEPPPRADFSLDDPANVSPLIAWLADATCPANGQVFHAEGGHLIVSSMPPIVHRLPRTERWTLEQLDDALKDRLVPTRRAEEFFAS